MALIDRYIQSSFVRLEAIIQNKKSGIDRLKALLTNIVDASGHDKSLCLCGMLSADIHSLSEEARSKISHFFGYLEGWIEEQVRLGLTDGSIHASIRPKSTAKEMVATLQGAMLLARVETDSGYLTDIVDLVLARLRA